MEINFFPQKNIILQIGDINLYFYGAMYSLSAILGFYLITFFAKKKKLQASNDTLVDLVFFTVLGGIIGGRIFEILVYNFGFYLQNPLEIFMVWHGGMSIHGGLIGGAIAFICFTKKKKIPLGEIANIIIPSLALGLMLGRLGNFMNDELYGRITEVSWGMDFGDGENRHPTQLYAMGKDFLLILLGSYFLLSKKFSSWKNAEIFLIFLGGYGILRFIVEQYKEIDAVTGLFWNTFTIGQILSIIMIIGSIGLWQVRRKIFN